MKWRIWSIVWNQKQEQNMLKDLVSKILFIKLYTHFVFVFRNYGSMDICT